MRGMSHFLSYTTYKKTMQCCAFIVPVQSSENYHWEGMLKKALQRLVSTIGRKPYTNFPSMNNQPVTGLLLI